MTHSPREPGGRPRARGGPRGTLANPPSRFDRRVYTELPDGLEPPPEDDDFPAPPARTRYFRDPSRTLLATNESPDLSFDTSLNPYRGCAHGCVYCFARPTHEYLGFSAGLDFETRILVKEDAPVLLRRAFESPRWRPRVVALGAVTDPYQPVERRLRITRRCLEVFAEFRNPVAIVTKGALVTRDVDLLAELTRFHACAVFVSVTTLDPELARRMEPRAAPPARRLEAIASLAGAGVPVGALLAPVIPAVNESEIPAIVAAVARAGAQRVGHVLLRLPHGLKDLFEAWLREHFPERRQRVLSRLRAVHGGRLYDARFHARQRGSGPFAEHVESLFRVACRRAGLSEGRFDLRCDAFRRPPQPQLSLFDPA